MWYIYIYNAFNKTTIKHFPFIFGFAYYLNVILWIVEVEENVENYINYLITEKWILAFRKCSVICSRTLWKLWETAIKTNITIGTISKWDKSYKQFQFPKIENDARVLHHIIYIFIICLCRLEMNGKKDVTGFEMRKRANSFVCR